MKKLFILLAIVFSVFSFSYSQICSSITFTASPQNPTASSEITLNVVLNCPDIAWTTGDVYIWMWGNDDASSANGEWSASEETHKMTKNVDGSYTFVFTPSSLLTGGTLPLSKIGFLIKAKNGTGDNKTIDQEIVISATNISAMQKDLTVFPNPVSSVINIDAENSSVLQITDMTGKIIITKVLENNNQIDMSDYKAGVYFFVISNDQKVETIKVVKNK